MILRLKLLKNRMVFLIYCCVMLIIAFFFNRFLQFLTFLLAFNFIQDCFAKRFHASTIIEDPIKATKYCKIITISIHILYLIFCKELNITLYSNLFIIFSIALLNCLLEFTLSKLVETYCTLSNKEYLIELCNANKISEIAKQRMIMRYVEHKSIKEIAIIESVDENSIKQSLRRTKRALRIP